MTVRPLATSNRTGGYQVTDEDNDLGAGAPITPTTVTGINTNLLGYTNPAAAYNSFAVDDIIIAEDTGRIWRIGRNSSDALVLLLISDGSGGSSPSSGPDIVLVTANKAGKYAPFGMSSAVYSTLGAAVTALPAGGGTVILLDDTYTLVATQALPANTRLFAFSDNGVTITGNIATPLLTPAGNFELRGVTVINAGAGAAVAPTADGSARVSRSFVSKLDGSVSNVAMAVTVTEQGEIDELVGGTSACTLEVDQGTVSSVVFPTAISSATLRQATVNALDIDGPVTADQGTLGDVGGTVPPASLTATGTNLTGTTYSAVNFALHGVRSTLSGVTVSTTGPGNIDVFASNFEPDSAFTAGGDITVEQSEVGSATAQNTLRVQNASVAGNASASDMTAGKSAITGTTTTTSSLLAVESTFSGAMSLDGGASIRAGSRVSAQITMGAGATLTVDQSSVQVNAAGGGNGAIINNGGVVNLISAFVRANDTLLSVSGTGTVNPTGGVAGGCRFGLGLTVGESTSGVFVANVSPVSTLNANLTIAALTGSNKVFDTVRANPSAGGFSLEAYDAAQFPTGYRFRIYNVNFAGGFGFNVVPAGSDTINDATSGITVGPGNYLELERVGTGAWLTY